MRTYTLRSSLRATVVAIVLTVMPAQGPSPLVVVFSGNAGGVSYFGGVTLDFGDGTGKGQVCRPGEACRDFQITHSYSSQGAYTARLIATGEGSLAILGTAAVTVGP